MVCNMIIDVTKKTDGIGVFLGVWNTLNVKSQQFDLTAWVKSYGEGQVCIIAQRKGDEYPYQVADVAFLDGIATWTFDEADTAVPGEGAVAVAYIVGDEYIARTEAYRTYTAPTLGQAGPTPPDPWESWFERILEAAAQAAQSAQDAATSAAAASASETSATASEIAAAASAAVAGLSEQNAAESARDAQTALEGMVYVTFSVDENGHVLIRNGDLLGSTSFSLVGIGEQNEGHLEVNY